MAEISIISERDIEAYTSPFVKTKQRVITYQAAGLGLRTIWIPSDSLPDVVYLTANPGKAVPAATQSKSDAVRRAAIEADIAKLKTVTPPRKI